MVGERKNKVLYKLVIMYLRGIYLETNVFILKVTQVFSFF